MWDQHKPIFFNFISNNASCSSVQGQVCQLHMLRAQVDPTKHVLSPTMATAPTLSI